MDPTNPQAPDQPVAAPTLGAVVRSGAQFLGWLILHALWLHVQFPPRWQVFPRSKIFLIAGAVAFEAVTFLVSWIPSGNGVAAAWIAIFCLPMILWTMWSVPDRRWSAALYWSLSIFMGTSQLLALIWPPIVEAASIVVVITSTRMLFDAVKTM